MWLIDSKKNKTKDFLIISYLNFKDETGLTANNQIYTWELNSINLRDNAFKIDPFCYLIYNFYLSESPLKHF